MHRVRFCSFHIQTMTVAQSTGVVCRVCALVCTAIIIVTAATVAHAIELQGRLSSDLYVTELNGTRNWQPYLSQSSRATLWRGAAGNAVSFHSNVRWTTSFEPRGIPYENTNVREARLVLNLPAQRFRLSAGRQFVYSGAGSVVLDGVRAHYRTGARLAFDAYAGGWVSPSNPESIGSLSKNGTYGGRVQWTAAPDATLGLSALHYRSDDVTEMSRVSVDGERRFDLGLAFVRFTYDLIRKNLGEFLGRVTLRKDNWYGSGEITNRTPSVRPNSIFGLIDSKRYTDLRASVNRTLVPGLIGQARVEVRLLDGDNSWRTSLGVSRLSYSVAWVHQDGYGGSNNGLRGHITHRFQAHLEVYGSATVMRYKIQDEQDGRSDAHSAVAGVQWTAPYALVARTEIQYLRNAVKRRDARLLIRVSRRFSLGASAKGGDR